MSSTHLYQIFYLHETQSLDVYCKPNDRFLYNTHTGMKWFKMIYLLKISTKEIHQQNYLCKVSQIALTERSKITLLQIYLTT